MRFSSNFYASYMCSSFDFLKSSLEVQPNAAKFEFKFSERLRTSHSLDLIYLHIIFKFNQTCKKH